MEVLIDILPWLMAMAALIACSAFFSASEAALFYLRWEDRRELQRGTRAQRTAARLLDDPDRLLSAVLFWNLVSNITYFAIVSIAGLQLHASGKGAEIAFATGALLAIIFFSEMLPKSVAVLSAKSLAAIVGVPLSVAVRMADPLMPTLRLANLLSQRLIWPRFQPESYLQVADLERAIELSTSDAQLIEQEQTALRNIVLLSDIRVDEWMRPRTQFLTFRPPVSLSQLEGQMTPSGYLFVTEQDSDEVVSAVHLEALSDVPAQQLERYAQPVVYIPWCATVADSLQRMQEQGREVAAVVNEFGETIGILTFEDLLDTIFTYSPSRSRLLMDRKPIQDLGPGKWLVAGVTSLRRLERFLNVQLPHSRSVTVAGIVQETLQRLVTAGDQCDWGPFHIHVLDAPQRGHMLLELTLREPEE